MPGPFSDPVAVASYHERARNTVPGLTTLHRLVDHLLGETVPENGRVLVVGAGGGLELLHLAESRPGWQFDGVDPSKPMLDLARETLGVHLDRVDLHEGEASSAPAGPFDGATCLLTLHFLPEAQRLETLREIHRRLRPGAQLVTCHISAPEGDRRRTALERFSTFAGGGALAGQLPILTPEADEGLLREAGFTTVELYYAALALRGWVAQA